MITTVNLYTFRRAFERMSRSNFSYEGLEALFNYLEDLERDLGETMELDVVGLCCDYAEDTVEGIIESYSIKVDGLDDAEKEEAVASYLQENTTICGAFDGVFVFAQF